MGNSIPAALCDTGLPVPPVLVQKACLGSAYSENLKLIIKEAVQL